MALLFAGLPNLRASDELAFALSFEKKDYTNVQKLLDQWMGAYASTSNKTTVTRVAEFVSLNQIAMTYNCFLIVDWARKGGMVARNNETSNISEHFAPTNKERSFFNVTVMTISSSIRKQDQTILDVADVVMVDPPVYVLGCFTPKNDHQGVVTLIPMQNDVLDVVLRTAEDIIKSPVLKNSFSDLNRFLINVVKGYQNYGVIDGVTATKEKQSKFILIQYMTYRINLMLNPDDPVSGSYIMTCDPQIVKAEEVKDGVAYARQVDPKYSPSATGMYVYGGPCIVNLDFLDEIAGINPVRGIVPPGWDNTRTEIKKVVGTYGQSVAKEKYICATHEKSHKNRWTKVARKIFPNGTPKNLTLEQFSKILWRISQTHDLDETLARLGEMNISIREGRKNDIWESLYFLLAASEDEKASCSLIFTLLSGEHDDLVKKLQTALDERNAQNFTESLQREVDSRKLAQVWLAIATNQLHGVANSEGKLPTDVLADRVQNLYGLLYDGWDFMQDVHTPLEER
jgi:hypothetical protein